MFISYPPLDSRTCRRRQQRAEKEKRRIRLNTCRIMVAQQSACWHLLQITRRFCYTYQACRVAQSDSWWVMGVYVAWLNHISGQGTCLGMPAMPVIKCFQEPRQVSHRRADNQHMKDLMGAPHDIELAWLQAFRDPDRIDSSPKDV